MTDQPDDASVHSLPEPPLPRARCPWRLALGAALLLLVGMVAGAVLYRAWLSFEPVSPACATLHIAREQPRMLENGATFDPTEFETYRQRQMASLRMRTVLVSALRDPKISQQRSVQSQTDPVAWLERHLSVESPPGSEYIRIRVTGGTPDEQPLLINAVVNAYMGQIVEKEETDRAKRLQSLKSTIDQYQEQLKEKRRYLRGLADVLGKEDTTGRLEAETLRLREFEKELTKLQIQEIVLKSRSGDQAKAELAALDEANKSLMVVYANLRRDLEALPKGRLDITAIQDEIDAQTEIVLHRLQREMAVLSVNLLAEPRIRVIELAEASIRE